MPSLKGNPRSGAGFPPIDRANVRPGPVNRGKPALVLGLVTLLLIIFLLLLLLHSQGSGGSGGGTGHGGAGTGDGTGRGQAVAPGTGTGVAKGGGASGKKTAAGGSQPAPASPGSETPNDHDSSSAPETPKAPAEKPQTPAPAAPPVKGSDMQITSTLASTRPEPPKTRPEDTATTRRAGTAEHAGGESGGAPGELGTGDVSFRLYWKPAEGDFDLHVVDPKGHHISYNDRRCPCGGEMDRDDTTSGGPENVFWPAGKAPNGNYRFYVQYFAGTGPSIVVLQVYRGRKKVAEETVDLQRKGDLTREFIYAYGRQERPAAGVGGRADAGNE